MLYLYRQLPIYWFIWRDMHMFPLTALIDVPLMRWMAALSAQGPTTSRSGALISALGRRRAESHRVLLEGRPTAGDDLAECWDSDESSPDTRVERQDIRWNPNTFDDDVHGNHDWPQLSVVKHAQQSISHDQAKQFTIMNQHWPWLAIRNHWVNINWPSNNHQWTSAAGCH